MHTHLHFQQSNWHPWQLRSEPEKKIYIRKFQHKCFDWQVTPRNQWS